MNDLISHNVVVSIGSMMIAIVNITPTDRRIVIAHDSWYGDLRHHRGFKPKWTNEYRLQYEREKYAKKNEQRQKVRAKEKAARQAKNKARYGVQAVLRNSI